MSNEESSCDSRKHSSIHNYEIHDHGLWYLGIDDMRYVMM